MQEYVTVSRIEAREMLLKDTTTNKFLTSMGLFTKEIINYLESKKVKPKCKIWELLPYKDADTLSEKIAGNFYGLTLRGKSRRRILQKRTYPGKNIFYTGNAFMYLAGYPRLIYEVLDSSRVFHTNPVNILATAVENGNVGIWKFGSRNRVLSRYTRRLENLGFINFDGKTITPTKTSIKIFSPEIRKVWEELKQWEHRIDVWK